MSVEYVLFVLRVVFIFAIYFFIMMVARVLSREIATPSDRGAAEVGPVRPQSRSVAIPGVAYFVVIDGAESGILRGTALPVSNGTSIGRASGVDLQLGDAYTSSEHAQVRQVGERWMLEDRQSMNGSYVNGQRVHGTQGLADGDTVQLGRIVLQFVLRPPA